MQLMQNDPKKAKAVAKLISQTVQNHGIVGINIKTADIKITSTSIPYIYLDPCPFLQYFYSLNAAKPCKLFAYKKAKRALNMLKNDELHLTNLELNEGNDPSEYQEFWLRIGNLSQMIPDDYDPKVKYWLCNKAGKLPMDVTKEKIYLYCMTNTFNLPRHWMEYADKDAGVCIEYDINISSGFANPVVKFGRVHYDMGYDFEFIKDICHKMRRQFAYAFIPTGFTKFANFYKRNKYKWEDETRLVVNLNDATTVWNNASKGKGGMRFSVDRHGDVNHKVLILENSSAQIKWTIRNVFLGSRIKSGDEHRITNILQRKYAIVPQ